MFFGRKLEKNHTQSEHEAQIGGTFVWLASVLTTALIKCKVFEQTGYFVFFFPYG